ncbi:cell division control protein 4 [Schizopora paradoxa]|uniref:Cell division control protein 4 n=1 Tax=Schizopora paradoxa TaxID=27342 RepID=A0A0H2SHP4_9AGAM|nr:cell division control protein 4 [Schizopora paradoxa]
MDEGLEHRRLQHGGSSPAITAVLLADDRIITASDDNRIRVFSFEKNTLSYVLEGHGGGVWAVDVLDDTLVSGSTDTTIRVWDLKAGKCTHTFKGHEATVRCVKIARLDEATAKDGVDNTPGQPLIVSGSRDSTLRVWRLPSYGDVDSGIERSDGGETLEVSVASNPYHSFLLEGHTAAVRGLAVHGRIAVSGSYDNSVRVWDIEKGTLKWNMEGHTNKVYVVAYDASRNLAYSGSMDMTVRIWNLENGQCSRVLSGHNSLVGLLNISPNNLVSASADATLRVWDPETGDLKHVLSAHKGAVVSIAHDDDRILSATGKSSVLWNARNGSVIRVMYPDVGGRDVWQVALDGQRCVLCSTTTPGGTFIDTWRPGEPPSD